MRSNCALSSEYYVWGWSELWHFRMEQCVHWFVEEHESLSLMPLCEPDVKDLLRSVWQRSIGREGPHGYVQQRWLRRVCALLGWFSNALYYARESCQQGRLHMDILSTVVSELKAEIRKSDRIIAESNQLLAKLQSRVDLLQKHSAVLPVLSQSCSVPDE